MDLGLKELKVITTGGSRGIGRAALEIFAAEGCDIGFFSRRQEQVDEAIASLSKHGGKVVGRSHDLEDIAGYPAVLTAIADELGGCDIFNPGASASGAGAAKDWDKCYQYDVLGTVRGCEALEPYLEKSEHGSIVMMASTAATETFIAPNAFNAMKAALLTYAKQLGQLWGPKGIRVNCISPGPIFFEGGNWDTVKKSAPQAYESFEKQMVLGKFGQAEDVAKTLVFLASPASAHTTGTNVVIDGGYTKRVQF